MGNQPDRSPILLALAMMREKYSQASRDDLLLVVATADRCWQVEAEFGRPMPEYVEALDRALDACPGTTAWNLQQKLKETPK